MIRTNRNLYPAFLDLAGRKVVVVGGGEVAAQKVGSLLEAGATVTVVAPELAPALADLARAGRLEALRQPFRPSDLDGAWWVVAAAPPEVNRAVGAAAEDRGLFVNAVDDPAAATAYLGGVVRRGGITLAISSEGAAPALVGLLREALDALLPEDLPLWVERAGALRRDWRKQATPFAERRPLLLLALNTLYQGKRQDAGVVAPPVAREGHPRAVPSAAGGAGPRVAAKPPGPGAALSSRVENRALERKRATGHAPGEGVPGPAGPAR